jgi:uncharacterized protein
MKFQPDTLAGVNAVTRLDPHALWVGPQRHDLSVVVPWRGEVQPLGAATFEDLRPSHFEAVAALGPEVVILGTGARLRFAPPPLVRALIERRIGVECMDTGAAGRTYNVLAMEGRKVVGLFLLAGEGGKPTA